MIAIDMYGSTTMANLSKALDIILVLLLYSYRYGGQVIQVMYSKLYKEDMCTSIPLSPIIVVQE